MDAPRGLEAMLGAPLMHNGLGFEPRSLTPLDAIKAAHLAI